MHFAILVEDASGKVMLEGLVSKIVGTDSPHTFEIHAYKGIGHIPKGLTPRSDPEKRILLDQLPRLLAGYGKAFRAYGPNYPAAVIVVCDLDDRNLKAFRRELADTLDSVRHAPSTSFCLAIEEGEAWLLGDVPAVLAAYPKAKVGVLDGYQNDSICNTWECLADAVYSGGSRKLVPQGYRVVGAEKVRWARDITPHMDVQRNKSPSFREFVTVLKAGSP